MSKLIQDHIDRWGRDRRDLYAFQIFNLHLRVNEATPIEREEYWHFANGKLFSNVPMQHRRENINVFVKHPKLEVVRNTLLDTESHRLVNGWVDMESLYGDLVYFDKLIGIREALERLTYCQLVEEMIHCAWEHYSLIELMPLKDYGDANMLGDKVFEAVQMITGIKRKLHEGADKKYELLIPIDFYDPDIQIVLCRHYDVRSRIKSSFWTDDKDIRIDRKKAYEMLRSLNV